MIEKIYLAAKKHIVAFSYFFVDLMKRVNTHIDNSRKVYAAIFAFLIVPYFNNVSTYFQKFVGIKFSYYTSITEGTTRIGSIMHKQAVERFKERNKNDECHRLSFLAEIDKDNTQLRDMNPDISTYYGNDARDKFRMLISETENYSKFYCDNSTTYSHLQKYHAHLNKLRFELRDIMIKNLYGIFSFFYRKF